jgi:FKBP-type peptidyl-prolyl cis-trans isomerase
MTKKEIGLLVGVFVLIFAGVGAAVFILSNNAGNTPSKAYANKALNSQQTTPLSEGQNTADDSLTVVAGQNTTNAAQLGSGQVASTPNGGTVAPAAVPGPETFAQYDQYKTNQTSLFGDIEKGTGNEAVSGKKVAVYYKGWLTNGQIFDQSKPGGDGKLQPFVFTLGAGQVIAGWEQSIAGMKVGGTRRLIIPPSVGYGATAQNGIPANSVLIFDVELLAIQ